MKNGFVKFIAYCDPAFAHLSGYAARDYAMKGNGVDKFMFVHFNEDEVDMVVTQRNGSETLIVKQVRP